MDTIFHLVSSTPRQLQVICFGCFTFCKETLKELLVVERHTNLEDITKQTKKESRQS